MAANTRFAVAVHATGLIAFGDRFAVTSDTIAKSVGTNPVVVRRLLGQLVRAGLVEAKKGHGGGAALARPAAKISLGDIYRAVSSGPLLAIPSSKQPAACPLARVAAPVLALFFQPAEASFLARLDQTSLAQVIDEVCRQQKGACA
jgi:Rrf2 family protein